MIRSFARCLAVITPMKTGKGKMQHSKVAGNLCTTEARYVGTMHAYSCATGTQMKGTGTKDIHKWQGIDRSKWKVRSAQRRNDKQGYQVK